MATHCWLCDAEFTDNNEARETASPGVLVCHSHRPEPVVPKFPKHPNASKFDRLYKRFLRGEIWPEVSCRHLAADGCEALQAICDRKFYD